MELHTSEILRYLGAGTAAPADLLHAVETCAAQLQSALRPLWTYRVFPLEHRPDGMELVGTTVILRGQTAARLLASCDQAVLLACTLGAPFDAMLRTAQARDMAQAVILDACGSAWVEAGCDEAERELAHRFAGRFLSDRFSPGYGDLPLDLQPHICGALDAGRRIGLYVTGSLLLNPSKSVTAIIGLANQPQMARIRGCNYCSMKHTCNLRKGGHRCANT